MPFFRKRKKEKKKKLWQFTYDIYLIIFRENYIHQTFKEPHATNNSRAPQLTLIQSNNINIGQVHPAYNPYFSACFFRRNNIFLSQ
jgi:hypothetical protein